jgi:hypothetical protein
MRRLVFFALTATMTAAALLLGPRHRDPPPPVDTPASARRPPPAVRSARTPALRRDARRFASAFLAYETGREDPMTRAAIRRGAVPRLAREILAGAGPRSGKPIDPRPLSPSLHLSRLPGSPDLALLTGTARRPSGPEPFAFLLGRRGGRWLALAPAE